MVSKFFLTWIIFLIEKICRIARFFNCFWPQSPVFIHLKSLNFLTVVQHFENFWSKSYLVVVVVDTSEYRDFQMCVHQVAVQMDVARVVRGLAVVWADLTDVALVDVEVVEAYLLEANFDKRLDYTDLDMNTSLPIQNKPELKLRWAYIEMGLC